MIAAAAILVTWSGQYASEYSDQLGPRAPARPMNADPGHDGGGQRGQQHDQDVG